MNMALGLIGMLAQRGRGAPGDGVPTGLILMILLVVIVLVMLLAFAKRLQALPGQQGPGDLWKDRKRGRSVHPRRGRLHLAGDPGV